MSTSHSDGALEVSSQRLLIERRPEDRYKETTISLRNRHQTPLFYKIKARRSTAEWYSITPPSGELPPGSSIEVKFKVYFLTEAARASTRDKVLITAWHPRSQSDPGSGTTSHLLSAAPENGQTTFQVPISLQFLDLDSPGHPLPEPEPFIPHVNVPSKSNHNRKHSDVSIKLIPPSRSGTQEEQTILHDEPGPSSWQSSAALKRHRSDSSITSDSMMSSTSSLVSLMDQAFNLSSFPDQLQQNSPKGMADELPDADMPTPQPSRGRELYSSRAVDHSRYYLSSGRPLPPTPGLLSSPSPGLRSRSGSRGREPQDAEWIEFMLCGKRDYASYQKVSGQPYATGGYSDVYKTVVKYRDGSFGRVAVKQLRYFDVKGHGQVEGLERMLKRLTRETFVWMSVEHPNIVPLVGFTLQPPLALISPWYEGGNIAVHLRRHPEADRLKLLHDVARGLVYLHSREPVIIHGDIKSDNVLIHDGRALLIDFGLSVVMEEVSWYTTSHRQGGNLRWIAPELTMNEDAERTPASDVYSFGCLAMEVVAGEVPYHWANDTSLPLLIVRGQKPAKDRSHYPGLSGPVGNLIYDCWEEESSRLDMPEVERRIAQLRRSV